MTIMLISANPYVKFFPNIGVDAGIDGSVIYWRIKSRHIVIRRGVLYNESFLAAIYQNHKELFRSNILNSMLFRGLFYV